MIQDTAQASALAEMGAEVERPRCPNCGCEMAKNGHRARQLTTRHEQVIGLKRVHLVCPQCGAGFFPPG
jgi:YgiT-type zinc finger domain-containing protein